MERKRNSRWYDEHKDLAGLLEKFRDMETSERDPYIRDIVAMVKEMEPEELSWEKAFSFPLDAQKRRWYDGDPELWLMINTLALVREEVIVAVVKYLKAKFEGAAARR